jgi:acyl carrier protein phosphodiesterase
VNFVAHVHVAQCLAADASDACEVAFGAALPDLSAMAGVRFDKDRLPEPVREGVVLHHRTDSVFHSHPRFTSGVATLRERLRSGGLAPGPSRAVGHAGWELLLDGHLLRNAAMEEMFANVLVNAPEVTAALEMSERERWRRLLRSTRVSKWWLGYRESEVVAERLERRLRERRRLAFAPADLPAVAEALARSRPEVALDAEPLLADVLDRLRLLAKDGSGSSPPVR